MYKTTTSFDDDPCDYQKAGSCLVPGAVENDRDITFLGTFYGKGKKASFSTSSVPTGFETPNPKTGPNVKVNSTV